MAFAFSDHRKAITPAITAVSGQAIGQADVTNP
jgi:hypothetical protein